MHYPWWFVPVMTAPMLIATIAVLHIYVAMYAVGGGLFLAAETSYAYRRGNRAYLAYLKDHTWFFILLTVVYGAITGVGIWWTIGLASPLATETLIHIFVFGWAMEYVFFVLEIVAAFIFFYTWGRLEPRIHQAIGWIYGISAWISLVLITAITGFMLNSGSWADRPGFWVGFFNPQFVPQVLTRTGGAFLLAALYVYLHAAFRAKDPEVRSLIARRSTAPGMVGAALVTAGAAWWYVALPESSAAALARAPALNIMLALVVGATVVVYLMLYLGPYRNPGWITPGFALMLFFFGLAATGAGEFIREAVRKPYIVYGVVLGNQVLPGEVPQLQGSGYLEGGTWTRAYVAAQYPEAIESDGAIDEAFLVGLPERDRLSLGALLFQYHCNDCHSGRDGYSAVAHAMRGWTPEMILDLVENLDRVQFFMPPFSGTAEEASLLADYLGSIAKPYPAGLPAGELH
jgi:cytochrome bd-type quinol oxidase subunit 1